jgi:hypothetical protein
MITFDFAKDPLVIEDAVTGDDLAAVVSSQAFLHFGFSFALWDRLLAGIDMPVAVAQSGEDGGIAGLSTADGAAAGDFRFSLRGRVWGEYYEPFQFGVGAHLWAPSGPDNGYTGEGSVYGQPQLLFGGRAPRTSSGRPPSVR